MAQDAELKLKVSLDLGFFRQQLAGLGQAAAGYSMPINVRLDRRSVQNELNALGANIRRRNYTLNVNTNLKAEIDNASKLAKALDELGRSRAEAQQGINQQLGLGQLLKGPQSGGLGSKDVARLYRAAARAGILEYNKEVIKHKTSAVAALEAVGSDSVRGLLNGLKSEDEKLKAAAEYLGESLIKTVKDVLGIASPSREFKKIGQNVGEGFQQGMMSSMDKAFDAVEGLMRARMKVLDTIARGMFRMAGIDPAAIRAEAAQRRALPGVDFPATVPRRDIPIGPSGTGRALPPGAIPSALPGTAFSAQRYLPTALSDELKRILSGAAFAFVDAIRAETRSVRIGIGASMQAALPAARIAGLLPAGVGRAPSTYSTGAIGGESREQMMARRTAEAYARSALRGMDVMGGGAGRPPSPYSYAYRSARPTSAIVPYAAGGAMVPTGAAVNGGGMTPPGGGGGGRGGFGGFGGLGGFGRAIGGVNLPGAGTIRELGSEFAFATKQVLLFGQAYKLLGFLQSFPGQVGAAVGQLQTFRNTLGAISPTAEEAAASNRLILDLVERYNVPLQSAREGFTKLYASMAPAGFSGDEIRDLFTGITQAAATFGMSADKVDRVNYAFAQMASKGQVMSEELKGQLGDVLPGAMALFAKAAGFEGPKAIQDFSAALEDGAYKGEAMVALLKNVGIVMKQEFGPGAEGAALTFQGIINRMQNSMVLLYESFEPVAVSFLNAVVVPLTSGIQQISDGFTAFFTGVTAQTTGGFAIAQELERLRPTFNGLRENLSGLTEQLGQFARIALDVGKVFLQITSSPIVGYLAKLYAIALPINMALNVMRGLWAANALQLVIFNARVAAGTGTLTAFRGMMAATGATAQSTAASIRATGTVLRTFFAATGVGVVITGISMLIERIMMLNQKMDETRQKATGAANAIRMMSGTEALAAERSYAGYAKSLEGLNKQLQEGQLQGKAWIAVNRQQAEALKAAGVTPSEVRGQAQVQPTRISGAYQKLVQMQGEAAYRRRQLDFEASQIKQSAVLAPIPEATGGDAKEKSKKGARRSLAELVSAEVLMLADAEKAAIKYAEAQSRAMAPDTAQAQRMLDYYSKFRNNLVDMQAIQAQITIAEKNRGRWISEYGMTAEQIDGNIKELRNQLKIATIDLATTEQEYRNQAKKDAAEEAEEIQKKIEKQKELGRLIEDAQIAAGIISPQQAAILQQRRGFEDAQARVQQEGTPEQLAQLTAAQALIPEAGSLQETIKTLREELDKLTSSQELVKASALSIGDAFSKSFKDAITGASSAQEALAGFFQSVASSFADMAAQMIQKMIQIYILDQFLNILPGGGMFKGNASIQGGGFGSFSGGAFGIDAGGSLGQVGQNLSITPFANGGIVTGPTMGLIGEGRYNEAVVPLPDGKSIPVDLGKSTGDSGVNIVVNVDAKGTNVQGDNQMGRQLGGAISAAVQAELIKQKRPGGLLAR